MRRRHSDAGAAPAAPSAGEARHAHVIALAAVALALLGAGCGNSAAPAERSPPTPTEPAGRQTGDGVFGRIPSIVARVAPSVVAVLVDQGGTRGEGSGVIWDSDGIVVTNDHVVADARAIEVALASGRRLAARIQARDPVTDLAVLKVNAQGLPAAAFAKRLPTVGALAIAIGNPLGFENTITAGIVSGLHRAIPSGGSTPPLIDLIQTDAAISPGNSGGALVDGDGQVIGINVAYIPPQARAVSIGFALPSPTVREVVEELLERGRVEHAFLGVQPAPVTAEVAREFALSVREGAIVLAVTPGSPAARAGLRAGDVIVAVGAERLRSVEDLFSSLRRHAPGDTVTLSVVRGRESVTLRARLSARQP